MHHQNLIYLLYYVEKNNYNKSFIQAHQLFKSSSILRMSISCTQTWKTRGMCCKEKKNTSHFNHKEKVSFLTYKTSCNKTIISKLDSKNWWYYIFPSLLIFFHSPKVPKKIIDLSLNLILVHDLMGT